MDNELSVSIVIKTRNRLESLKKCIASVLAVEYSHYDIIIVDDASTDGTGEFLKQHYANNKKFHIIYNPRHLSIAYASNLGIQCAMGEIVAFTDDDCVVYKDWLTELTKPYRCDPKVMAVGGLSYIKDTNQIYKHPSAICGCNISFRASILRRFQFDPNLKYSHYHDEKDIVIRIWTHGYVIEHTDKAIVRHFEEDAEHRRLFFLGEYLNQAYLDAKDRPLIDYYSHRVGGHLKIALLRLKQLCFQERAVSCFEMLPRSFFIFYLLVFEIPIKARIKRRQEDRLYRAARDPIHIVAATDERYWHHTAAMLLSLISHHRSCEEVVCHLINSGLTDRQKDDFIAFFNPKGLTIDWLTIDPAAFKDFPVIDYLTHAMYYRFDTPRLVSPSIKKIIYLDSDTLLLDDISKLWHLDTGGMPVAAAENFHSFHKERLGVPAGSKYFNSGVLIIDLEYWRRHNISEELKNIIVARRERILYPDQDALNLLFFDKCFFIPPKWNFYCHHEEIIRLFSLHTKQSGLKEAIRKPSLVHFITGLKPDNHEDFSPYADLYRSYFHKIPFIRERLAHPSFDQRIRKFLYLLRQIFVPYWLKRIFLQLNPEKQRPYWPGLPDWYW